MIQMAMLTRYAALTHNAMLISCSFGKLHPALADKHYLRTSDENERILDAKLRLQHSLEQQHLVGKRAARPATADGGGIRGSPDKRWAALRQVCLRRYAVLTHANCLTALVKIRIIWYELGKALHLKRPCQGCCAALRCSVLHTDVLCCALGWFGPTAAQTTAGSADMPVPKPRNTDMP